MADRERLKHFAAIAAVGALAGLGSYYLDREVTPDPNFKCTFVARPDAASVRLGDIQGPIQKIGVGGYLSNPFQEAYSFKGRATLLIGGQPRSYVARGSVFFWEPGHVGDLMITISADEYAQQDFSLITFDKNGSLSKNPNEAFAFDDPKLKTVHPMNYRCSLIGPLPKPTDKDN